MRRLLVVAGDRLLTRFFAESLLGRSAGAGSPRPGDPWDISRAHTGLEALILVTRGGRTFDVIVIDHVLPDQDGLQLLDRLRRAPETRDVPIFLISERGRDLHSRRLASERYDVAGFLEKPVTAESIRNALGTLDRRRRVLLVEPDPGLGEQFEGALRAAGYVVERASSGLAAIERAARFSPDLAISALHLEDLRGTEVCVELKRTATIPVVLYGKASSLVGQAIEENAHRADDFVEAPDPALLVERVKALIGRGVTEAARRSWATEPPRASGPGASLGAPARSLSGSGPGGVPTAIPARAPSGPAGSEEPGVTTTPPAPAEPTSAGASTREYPEPIVPPDVPPAAPPPSASPAPSPPARRANRRVPCELSMSIRDGDRSYSSKTLDISHGGIFLAIDEPLELGALIDLTFELPNTTRPINATGKVAWVVRPPDGSDETAGVGVKFSKIDPRDLQLIVDYVNRVSRVVYAAP